MIDSIPNPVVALYSTYADAVQNTNRMPIVVSETGTNIENQLWLGAKVTITKRKNYIINKIGLVIVNFKINLVGM